MTIIYSVITVSLLIQFYHWRFIFRRAADVIPPHSKALQDKPFLSVVICFHKKWSEIPAVLNGLVKQTYPNFEIVLVNDGPVELDDHIIEGFIRDKNQIQYVEHIKTSPGKKPALARGIDSSRGEWIVLTDIDCHPGPEWLESLSSFLPSHPAVILGFSPYRCLPGFLNFVVRQETLLTAFQYLGWARNGYPYMGVGRNMAYHREIYQALTFDSHKNIPMGDDDLFVNEAAGQYPVYICNDRRSFVVSEPVKSWVDWYRQKTRHKSGGKYYSMESRIRIAVFILAMMLEKLLLVWLLFVRIDIFLIFVGVKLITMTEPLSKLYGKFDRKQNFWKTGVYEWIHVIYLILVMPYIFFITKRQWD